MKTANKPSQENFKWENFEVKLSYEQNRGLQLYLKNSINQRKFRTFCLALPDSLKCCSYGSLEELYCDLSRILTSKDKSDLSRLKIEDNGTIKISKKSNGKGKIGEFYTEQYFHQETCKGTPDQQRSPSNFSGDKTNLKFLQMSLKISNQQKQICKLQNQLSSKMKYLQNFIDDTKKKISSLSSNKYNRRSKFMKSDLGEVKKIQKIFISGFLCDFYLRDNRCEIFFVNVQNGDEFAIEIQSKALAQSIIKEIEYLIKQNLIDQKIKIDNFGKFTIIGEKKSMGQLVEYEQSYQGLKIECNNFQNIQKSMWLQKQKNEQSIILWKAQMKKQFQKKISQIQRMFKAQTTAWQMSKILTNSQQYKKLIGQFKSETISAQSIQLRLLFRASQFNYSSTSFHQKCDNIPNTLVLIKTEFGRVIGGFTPLKWDKNANGHTKDQSLKSFLFSLTYGQKLRLQNSDNAIYSSLSYGPTFGGANDLCISNQSNSNSNSYGSIGHSYKHANYHYGNQQSYTRFTGSSSGYNFKTSEYQVFEVIFNNS